MNTTEALREASRAVSRPTRHPGQNGFTFYAPYYNDKPRGPTTECRARSMAEAWHLRRTIVAHIALALVGESTDQGHDEIEMAAGSDWPVRGAGAAMSARQLLTAGRSV